MKVTFMGAGSTVFSKNVLGDIMCTPDIQKCDIALYDIDPKRLEESFMMLSTINKNINENRAVIKTYLPRSCCHVAVWSCISFALPKEVHCGCRCI